MYGIITNLSVTRRPECVSVVYVYMSYCWHTAILQPVGRIFLCWYFFLFLQAIPYVNGTLYSLLAHPQLNHEAKHMGLCGVLEYYLKVSFWSGRGIGSVRSWMVKEFSAVQTFRWNTSYFFVRGPLAWCYHTSLLPNPFRFIIVLCSILNCIFIHKTFTGRTHIGMVDSWNFMACWMHVSMLFIW